MNKNNSSNAYYKIGIIGGKWKNKKILVKNIDILRPTLSRIRETIFNWLSTIVYNSNCLDCFAGSGSLGLESLSRGAKRVVFLEKNHIIGNQISKNLKKLRSENSKIIISDVLKWILYSEEKFNLVFIDPPYYKNMVSNVIKNLEDYNKLENNSYIYIETEINIMNLKIPYNWKLYKKVKTKSAVYSLYIRYKN